MSAHLQIARTSASYGYYVSYARHSLRHDDISAARWYAKHARAEWRTLCHLTGQTTPKAHRAADSFAA